MKMLLRLLLFVVALCLGGCGGGSEGTGVGGSTIRISGTVIDDSRRPLEGVTVTVLDTGAFDLTDEDGNFDIITESSNEVIDLEVRRDDSVATTQITAPGENDSIKLEIKFNPLVNDIDVNELSVNARIVGECDIYFENFATIRQSNRIPGPLDCTAKVQVKSRGELLAHVPIAIEYRSCRNSGSWTAIALGATMTGANLGVAQISFPFRDDEQHCLYRIRAPFGVEGVRPVDIEIHTLTFQTAAR